MTPEEFLSKVFAQQDETKQQEERRACLTAIIDAYYAAVNDESYTENTREATLIGLEKHFVEVYQTATEDERLGLLSQRVCFEELKFKHRPGSGALINETRAETLH